MQPEEECKHAAYAQNASRAVQAEQADHHASTASERACSNNSSGEPASTHRMRRHHSGWVADARASRSPRRGRPWPPSCQDTNESLSNGRRDGVDSERTRSDARAKMNPALRQQPQSRSLRSCDRIEPAASQESRAEVRTGPTRATATAQTKWGGAARGGATVAALLLACGAAAPPSPQDALDTLTKALRSGDVPALTGLVSARDRSRLGAERLRALLSQLEPELSQFGSDLAVAPEPQVHAWLSYDSGNQVPLVWERGSYRLLHWPAYALRAETPAGALSALAQALQGGQQVAIVGLLANSLRVRLQEAVQRWILELRAPQSIEVAAGGRSARAVLPSGREVRLLRKAGLWWVSGID